MLTWSCDVSVNIPNHSPPHGDRGEKAEIHPKVSSTYENISGVVRTLGKWAMRTHSFQNPALTSEPRGLLVNEASFSLEPQLSCESSSDLGVLVFLGNAVKEGSPVYPHCSRLCKGELKIPYEWLDFPWQH